MTREGPDSSPLASELGDGSGRDDELVVAGIGASAGGLAALRTFFSRVPEKTGVAYVIVVHLSPDYESHLADLLQPYAAIPVRQVTEPVPVEPDHVYVIPPNANLSAVDTHLRLSVLEGHGAPGRVDHFFQTLATTFDGSSVAVVLTGTGSDGAVGIKAVKERNGFTIVQDPREAEHTGMPSSAIATGLIDRVLPLGKIPDAIVRFARTKPRLTIAEDSGKEQGVLLHKVFGLIRAQTGRDFGRYKRSTLLRRVQRRMRLREIEDLGGYLELLREELSEVQALADDILITVTGFFRDGKVWDYLAADVVPRLFTGKGPADVVRVWSTGCASGEEAYSLAILLLEEAARHCDAPRFQVFASDLHESSLDGAREGFYPAAIEATVSAERLSHFFHREEGGYRVRKEVRQHVTFAMHNLLSDPPFSRMDLVSCRNLMIYLDSGAQRDVVRLLHHALVPGGVLVIGTSESLMGSEFAPDSKQHHTYCKRILQVQESRLPGFLLERNHRNVASHPLPEPTVPASMGALHLKLVEDLAPPSMLVDAHGSVVHLSRHAGRYLVQRGGEPTTTAHKLVREELSTELLAALHLAREKGVVSRSRPISVRFDSVRASVVLDVRPAPSTEHAGFALVIFDERPETEPTRPERDGGPRPERVTALEVELEEVRQHMQTVIEQYEATQEAMRAANEELQSANEELRSTMEELETSREESQSMNEELQTLNQESRIRMEELSQLSSDLQNLLKATQIATIFLDNELRIQRFTPKISELFNVRPNDRGRPLSDLTHRLGYAHLCEDADRVLHTLVPVEQEVEDQQGRWYLTRLLPYRTVYDRIEGVVITFFDITQHKHAAEALRRNEERQRFLLQLGDMLRPISDPRAIQAETTRELAEHLNVDRVFYSDVIRGPEGEHLHGAGAYCSPGTSPLPQRLLMSPLPEGRTGMPRVVDDAGAELGISEAERAGMASFEIRALVRVPLIRDERVVAVMELHQRTPRKWTSDEVLLAQDVAERAWAALAAARAEAAMRLARDEAERANNAKSEFLSRMSHELRTPLNAILGFSQLLEGDLERDADREAINQVLRAGRHLLGLIDEVLNLASIEAGGVRLAIAPVMVKEVVAAAMKLVEPLAATRQISLSFSAQEEGLAVLADARRLKQVLINLLSNSVKFNDDAGAVEVAVARGSDERVRIAIRDTGWGLSPDEQERLFVPFERLKAETRGVPGTGLGLVLAKEIVALMDGEIVVESALGEGSTFSVQLPEASPGTPASPVEFTKPGPPTAHSSGKEGTYRVLYVEDNISNLRLIERVLAKRGDIELIAGMQGGVGVELAREHLPDLILLDLNLPDISGEEVLRRIREVPALADTPVVVISADATEGKKERLRAGGVQAYLTKPVDIRKLGEILASYLK